MRWNTSGIKFRRGCYEPLIARFDGKGTWYSPRAMMIQQAMRSSFRKLGEHLEAKQCEVKPLYDDDDNLTETDITDFDFHAPDNDLTDPTKWVWKFTSAEIHS